MHTCLPICLSVCLCFISPLLPLRFLKLQQIWRHSACKMPTRTLSSWGYHPATTPSGPPNHVHSSEVQTISSVLIFFFFSVHFPFNRNVSRNMNLCLSLPPKGVVKNLEKLNIPLSHKRFSLHYSRFPFTLKQSWINTITLNCLICKLHCDLKSCTFNNVILWRKPLKGDLKVFNLYTIN